MHNNRPHILLRSFTITVCTVIVLCIFTLDARAKDGPWKRLSRPEKIWSAFHPFKARKVLACARRSQFVTDSLDKAGVMSDKNGGQLDAFRHAFWMALMITEGMNETVVRRIGERHEKGNYLDFKNRRLEDSLLADSMMCVMDLRNNDCGISIGKTFRNGDKTTSLIAHVISEIWDGRLWIISKNPDGAFLDCQGNVIPDQTARTNWYVPKCLVHSDQIRVQH